MPFTKGHKINVGRIASEETRKKLSTSNKGKLLGRKNPAVSESNRNRPPEEHPMWGRNHSQKTKEKISKSRKGKAVGQDHWEWKGEKVSYFALHHWIRRHLGKPPECVYCGKDEGRLHWANISGLYLRDLADYIPLCPSCHKAYDKDKGSVKNNFDYERGGGLLRL